MNEKIYFIYETTCDINGKKYIGLHHGFVDDNYLGSGTLLLRAINKYGKDHFHRKILEICESKEMAESRERYYTNLVSAETNPNYYNLIPGGGQPPHYKGENHPCYGTHLSEERKKKQSKKMKGKYSGEKNPFYGKHHSEESKKKDAADKAERYKGKGNPFFGKHHSEDSKWKINETKGQHLLAKDLSSGEELYFPSVGRFVDFIGIKSTKYANEALQVNGIYHGYQLRRIDNGANS